MINLTNSDNTLSLGLNLQGGSISYFNFRNKNKKYDILRSEKKNKRNFNIIKTAGFPLTPFCNRINKNVFTYKNKKYYLKNNTKMGKYYLHGDGWLNKWKIINKNKNSIQLTYINKKSKNTPYNYISNQELILNKNSLKISLSVQNLDNCDLPFGLGFHPYFPKNKLTLLKAKSKHYWIEDKDYIPTKAKPTPKKLNFNNFNILPSTWTNNCFDNWDSSAKIVWPDKKLMLSINTSKNCKFFFLHVSSKKFEKSFKNDYFCFEPMTHLVNAHNYKHNHGLVNLSKNQKMKISISFKLETIND